MSNIRIRTATAGIVSVLALASVGASPALAKDGDVVRRGACTGSSDWKLKLGPRGGRIETEFEVDSNRVGQVWSVRISDNGSTVFTGSRTTLAPSGSFTVRTVIPNLAGRDSVVATATNRATGERCVGRAAV